jgi:cobalt-zinc-cadmium efflux system protein
MVTGAAVLRLRNGSSMNEKVLNWHLLEDVLGWVAVLVVSVLLLFLDWPVLDPLLAIGFTAFIVVNVCRNLRETLQLFFQAVPTEGLAQQIRTKLLQLDGVTAIHHAHCWSLDGEHHVYTAHLELGAVFSLDQQLELKQRIAASLAPFALTHTTIELELPQEACRDGD